MVNISLGVGAIEPEVESFSEGGDGMNWDDNLPDVSKWQPGDQNNETVSSALMVTCQMAQRRIIERAHAEIDFNLHNFDSGGGIEEIIREELSDLLPSRYSVDCGVISDRIGRNAGDCDLIVRDRIWSPAVKPGATKESRRVFFPIEGVYAASEIKQTLGFDQLDDAMRKLATISRLNRPQNPYGHITENQHLEFLDKPGFLLNPLYTAVVATRMQKGVDFTDVVKRFGAINSSLDRDHMVKMLCVLGYGTAWYSVETGSPYNADYMRDRNQSLILQVNNKEPRNSFYRFFVELFGHLNRSVLNLLHISLEYGHPPPNREVIPYPSAVFNENIS